MPSSSFKQKQVDVQNQITVLILAQGDMQFAEEPTVASLYLLLWYFLDDALNTLFQSA